MMHVISDRIDPFTRDSVCGIGSFDGVHRGHQEIARRLTQLAVDRQKVGIITFSPLPFFTLKRAPICCLTPQREKEEIFERLGVDFIYYFTFSAAFAAHSPEEFVELVARQIKPSTIVVGENFHFGKMRKGNAEMLKDLARSMFEVQIMRRISDDGPISSTRIRELLLLGNIKAANRLLGRSYSISGTVTKGKGKGQEIGFPTINIPPPVDKLIPLDGVYKVNVIVTGQHFLGAMFCRHDILEVHIINLSDDLYGKDVNIQFLERIRGIEHFADDDALKDAISKDIKRITG
jgi:riboflavin kinase/FMN adenylyltransferase